MEMYRELARDLPKLPNIITLVRLAFTWLPAVIIYNNPEPNYNWWWAFGIFTFVAATDFLDGWIARRFNQVTRLGKILDPLVDKLLIVPTLVAIAVFVYPGVWVVIFIVFSLEIATVTEVRKKLSKDGNVGSARQIGRIKMVAHSGFIAALLAPTGLYLEWWFVVQIALGIVACALSVATWFDYHATLKDDPEN